MPHVIVEYIYMRLVPFKIVNQLQTCDFNYRSRI